MRRGRDGGGLGDCLRMELALDRAPHIHVCTVLPASIDTPVFQQGANYTGRQVKAIEPVYPPEQVAQAIVRLVRHLHGQDFPGLGFLPSYLEPLGRFLNSLPEHPVQPAATAP